MARPFPWKLNKRMYPIFKFTPKSETKNNEDSKPRREWDRVVRGESKMNKQIDL
jgi:hypothetical protein